MVLAVTPGAKTTFAVQARYGNGGLHCTARLSEVVKVRMPGVVKGLKVVSRTATGAVIGWRAASRGDAPIAGYRVSLDGAVAGQTRSLAVHAAVQLEPQPPRDRDRRGHA